MSNERPTSEAEFHIALVELGVERCSVIYVTANIGSLGFPAYNSKKLITDKHEIAKFYLNCIEAVIGSQGTIVFPTHSWGMLTNPEPFDPVVTGCDYLFSEFILKNRPIKRQLHPLASLAATGPLADQLIPSRITRHAYGLGSAMERVIDANAIFLSLGSKLENIFTPVHHCEFLAHVPYRYIKSFRKNVTINGCTTNEQFFIHALYQSDSMRLERDKNKKIFELRNVKELVSAQPFGRGCLSSIPLKPSTEAITQEMLIDPFIWLRFTDGELPWEL